MIPSYGLPFIKKVSALSRSLFRKELTKKIDESAELPYEEETFYYILIKERKGVEGRLHKVSYAVPNGGTP